MSIYDYATTKTVSGVGTMKFEKPVTVFRLILAAAFFLVQWSAYAAIIEMLGGFGIINAVLSLAASAAVTYKLLRFLKFAKKVESVESE